MGVYVVVGGQFGSEGKGKICAYLTAHKNIDVSVRTGGPNAGHSFEDEDGTHHKLQQLPVACIVNKDSRSLIPAGGVIDLDILERELNMLELDADKVGIDRNAVILSNDDMNNESEHMLRPLIGSTLSGTGAATAKRIMRRDVVTAQMFGKWLTPFITNVADELSTNIHAGKNVLIEGTQGFGLSLYHCENIPYSSSWTTVWTVIERNDLGRCKTFQRLFL